VNSHVFLTAEWRHLAMLNYEVEASLLLPYVPAGTEIDRWNGKVFLSLVGFRFMKTRILGFTIPFHANFDEVNLRFYVRRQQGDDRRAFGGVPGLPPWPRGGAGAGCHATPARPR